MEHWNALSLLDVLGLLKFIGEKKGFLEIGMASVLKITDRLNSKQIALKCKLTSLHTSTVSCRGLGMEYLSNAEFLHLLQEKWLSIGCLALID